MNENLAPDDRRGHEDAADRTDDERGHALDRGWAGDERRIIHVRLSADEYWELRQRAHAAGLRPWDLARHWIVAQLDRPGFSGDAADASVEVESLAAMLFEQRRVVEHLAYRLDRIERSGVTAPGEYAHIPLGTPRNAPSGVMQPAHLPHPKLHEEILAVLHASGTPMTSEQISEAVTLRGRYRARSGHAVSAAAISGRIANPRYRGLFRREGRSITPAVPAMTESRSV